MNAATAKKYYNSMIETNLKKLKFGEIKQKINSFIQFHSNPDLV